jgi:hypothetical protein
MALPVAETSHVSLPSKTVEKQLKGDAPLKALEDDEFGLAEITSSLSQILATRISADGYVLGLEGAWGSGKSTLANFIAEQLTQYDEHVVIRFEPWLIGEKNALIAAFFGQLAQQIEVVERRRNYSWHPSRWGLGRTARRLSAKIRRYGEYMNALAVPVGGAIAVDPTGSTALAATGLKTASVFAKLFGKTPSLDQLKTEIVAGLNAVGKLLPNIRFTVIIDDTDRLEAYEALELLRLVRKVADFPFIAYVICFDANVLSQQVNHGLGIQDGRLYIEKIFQDIVHVPPQEPFALRRYLQRLLRKSFPLEMERGANDHEVQFRRETLFDRWCGLLVSTPRDVVRLHQSVELAWPYVPGELDFFDFIWLQLLKTKWPDLYSWTRDYLQNVGSYRDRGRVGDTEGSTQAQKLFELLKPRGWNEDVYLSGLDRILPGLNSLSLSFDKGPQVFKFEQGELEAFEQAKRLGSPSHWRGYFAFDMPSYAVRDADISAFRKAIENDPAQAAQILTSLFERAHERAGHFLDLLLDRLLDGPAGIERSTERSGMLAAFAETMDDFARRTDQIGVLGHNETWDRTRLLLRKSPPANFLAAVREGKSINWLAFIIRDQGFALGLPEGHRPYPHNAWLKREEFDECLSTIIKRFESFGMRKIFALPNPTDVLFCWVQLGDADDVRRRFSEATVKDAKFLRALGALRGWANSSDRGVHHPLYEQYVRVFIDPDEVLERLQQLATTPELGAHSIKAKELLAAWQASPKQ